MKPGAIFTAFALLLLQCMSLNSNATKRFVRQGYTGTGEVAWGNASGDLFSILSVSLPGDTVWVARGTYKPTTGTNRTISFFLKRDVVLQGGFEGYETYLYQRVIGNNPTILSGDIDTLGNNDSYHVIKKYPPNLLLTPQTVLDGFIIEKGRADNTPEDENSYGAAMYLVNSSLTISNCKFISNYSSAAGAIYSENGSPTFINCEFTLNSAYSAGVMWLKGNGQVSFNQCNFNNNTTYGPCAVMIASGGTTVTISRSIFKDNSGDDTGALLFITNGNVHHRIDNSIFIHNTISGEDINSARTLDSEDSMTVTNCNFYNYLPFPRGNEIRGYLGLGIYNCIFYGLNNMIDSSNTDQKLRNSIVQGGITGCKDCPGGNGNVNPLFSNINDLYGPDNIWGTADDGMRLTAYSAGIDAGLDSIFTTLDITGVSHGLDEGIDIGAYEGGVCMGTAGSRLYVDAAVTDGNGNGDSWQNAMAGLKLALNVAKSCTGVTEIWVAKGTYTPTSTSDRNRYFGMINGVSIYGGFQGNETALNQRNHKRFITTLSGNIDAAGTADSYNIIRNIDIDNTALLDGFTITGANNESATSGAGVYNSQSSPIIKNCVIKNNNAGNASGGGMYNYNHSSPQVLNCVFANNTATGGGGMFNASNSSPVIRNCVLINNHSLGNGGGMASGINSNPTLINCNIIANTAVGNGPGIYNLMTASPVITNCIFWGNGGVGKEIANGAISSVPVVSYSYVQGGYTPCTNCADYSTNPQFFRDFNWAGADSVYGTVDDEMHLNSPSPCLNTGNNAVVVDSLDVAGQPRIQDGTVNIGAYENLYLITLGNGNWHNPANWNLQRVPLATDHVYIKAGHQVTLDQSNGACKSILVQPGAKLQIVLPGSLQAQ